MVRVTKASSNYMYTNQDCDEKQAILSDLSINAHEYLAHSDSFVRCYADWTMEYWGIRNTRSLVLVRNETKHDMLTALYRRLQYLAG